MRDFKCDDGYTYAWPDDFCAFCKNCISILWDYRHGPYMFCCAKGLAYDNCGGSFEEEEDG